MRTLAADFRYALRTLRRSTLFAAVAVMSISLGIAANAAVFTLVDQVVLRQLPVTRPGQLVQVHASGTESFGGGMGDGTELSYPMYRDLRDANDTFSGMFARVQTQVQVAFADGSEVAAGELVTGSFFPELGLRPAAGRLLTPDDETAPNADAVAVLSHRYWMSRFHGDGAAIGRTLLVNGRALQIVGVVEPAFTGFDLGQPTDIYIPVTMQPAIGPPWLELEGRRFRWIQVFGRLRDGLTREGAQARLQPLYHSLLEREATDAAFEQASAARREAFLGGRLSVDDASRGHSQLRRSVTEPLLILMAIAGGLLLIVCANVANLLIARSAARHRELALRVAVGASRAGIVRLVLVESLVLAVLGSALGLLLASWGASLMLSFFTTAETPLALSADPDHRIVLFTSLVAALTAVAAGLLPALRSTRVDLVRSLKGTGGGVVTEQPRLRKTLVAAQVALSFLLLVGAGLFLRTIDNLLEVDPGFQTDRLVSFSVDLARGGYEAGRAHQFARDLAERLDAEPGLSGAAYAFVSILNGGGWMMRFTVEGYAPPDGQAALSMANSVSPGFFSVMQVPVVAGREFTDSDDRIVPPPDDWPYRVAVVNQTFVERYCNGENPIGRHVGFGSNPGTPTPVRIVGLVKDFRYTGIREDATAQIFFPYQQAKDIENVTMYVRTRQDPSAALQTVRQVLASLDPQLPAYAVETLDERVRESVVNERLIAALSATLAGMATILAVVGLYGVIAYTVARRTREIGVRMALGARGTQVAWGVVREAGLLIVAGLVAGLAGVVWLTRYVEAQLYGVRALDPLTIAAAAVLLTTVALAAALIPATRAAGVSPMAALREN
jgi:putative ABC transport system permease protein